MPAFVNEPEAKPRMPEFNLHAAYKLASESWVLQEIFRAIIQEVKRPGWDIYPRFMYKCEECGYESQETIEVCPICGSKELRRPDMSQRAKALQLLRRPNSLGHTFGDIIGSITYHDLVADDWYLSIEYRKATINGDVLLIPSGIRVEDPRYIKPIMDQYGRLGNNEWFCPLCWSPENDEVYDRPGACPHCGLTLLQTAYIQEINGQIRARFGPSQIVHGSTYRVLPNPFGTPRIKSLWNVLQVLRYMDEWFLDTFSEARLQKLICVPGYTQDKLIEFMKRLQQEIQSAKYWDPTLGRYRVKKKLRYMFMASKEPISVHDVGISPEDIGLLDYYRLAVQAVAGVYGVQAIFISWIEKGKAGTTPAMQIEVQNRTIREIQRDKEEIFNHHLLPKFGITDWEFRFRPLEKRDRVREAEIWQRKASAAITLLNAGFDVWFDEHGELHVSQRPVREPTRKRPIGATPPKKKISGASGMEIEGTTTEREPFGPRPASPQLEELRLEKDERAARVSRWTDRVKAASSERQNSGSRLLGRRRS